MSLFSDLLFVHGIESPEDERSGSQSESGYAGLCSELYGHGLFSVLLFVLIGTVLTMIVQASAATMAITLIMCANGWISFELGAALVLGENIGTTITANLAALTANTQARRAAMAHLMFNVFGVIWVLMLFEPFLSMVDWIISDFMKVSEADGVAVSFKLSAFHTCFNVCNVLILIWFVHLIEKTVCKIVPRKSRRKNTACSSLRGHAFYGRVVYPSGTEGNQSVCRTHTAYVPHGA